MRLGIISDIHSNIEALTAVLDEISSEHCDKIICLGDVVGYCASPRECIDLLAESNIICLRGNHDAYVQEMSPDLKIQPFAKEAIYWTRNILSKQQIEWLKALPLTYSLENAQFTHASLEGVDGSYWPYVLGPEKALLHFYMQTTRYCFNGHTHVPLLFTFGGLTIGMSYLKSQNLKDEPFSKYLISCGSVGQPRDNDKRSAYVIFDTETHDLKLQRCTYDVKKAQQRIIDSGLPPILAERLSFGF